MTRQLSSNRHSRGTTLVELVIATVVIAIAVTSVLGLLASISTRSAESLMATQAASVASAYLEEALSKAYVHTVGPAARANFDDVGDYNFVDNGARDCQDNAIAGLAQYRVQVSTSAVQLGVAPNETPAVQVTVSVTDPTGATTRLEGFRTDYAGQVLR